MIRRTFIGSLAALPASVSPIFTRAVPAAPRIPPSASGLDADLFIGYWKDATPRRVYGALEVWDLLTRSTGDPLRPTKKGAVLTEINSVSYTALAPRTSTVPTRLKGVQHILYCSSGYGAVKSRGKTWEIRQGIGIIAPPEVEFTLSNTGDKPLTMFLIEEPLRKNHILSRNLVVKNDYDLPVSTNTRRADFRFWLFSRNDGLSTLTGMDQIVFMPKTYVEPHVHLPGDEEIWIALDDMMIQIGKQQRVLPANSAYKVPADGRTPHVNVNETAEERRLLWVRCAPEVQKDEAPSGEKKELPDEVI